MYKTIRHGENSLQYTILPQNDDFRIEGKLTSAESCCSNGRKSKTKRPRRRSFFAYLGLLFVCTVIVGAVLIPFLVSADCLLNPTDWFMSKNNDEKHNKPISTLKSHGNTAYNNAHNNFMGNGINIGKTVKIFKQAGIEKVLLRINKTNNTNATENLKTNSNLSENTRANDIQRGINEIQMMTDDNTTSSINVQSNAQKMNQKSIFTNDIEMRNDQSQSTQTNAQLQGDIQAKQTNAQTISFDQSNQNLINNFAENPPNEHFVTEVRFEPVENVSTKPGIVPTIVVTTLRNQLRTNEPNSQQSQQQQRFQQQEQKEFIAQSQSQTAPNVRITTNLSNLNVAMNNNVSNSSSLMTRIIQVPLLKAAAKKPIIPPVLVKTNSQLGTANSLGSIRDGKLATPLPLDQQDASNVPSVVVKSNSIGGAKKSAKPRDWLNAHWPFVDSSTYFQWSGYKTEDSVLLPALLGFSLIGVILFISVCLVARNKRTIVSSVRKRNRNVSDVEENGAEDNTTLLTTACLSDED